MLNLTIILLLVDLANLLLIHAYTPLPVTIKDSRIKVVPNLAFSPSFVYEDAAYLYGGLYAFFSDESMSTTMYRFEFIEESATLKLSIVNTTNSGPKCLSCTIYSIPNTTKIYVLSYEEPFDAYWASLPLYQPYVFDFNTKTWANLTDTAIYNGGIRGNRTFEYRESHSSALVKNSRIYIIGGEVSGRNKNKSYYCGRSVIYYDIQSNSFNVLDKDAPECRVGANSFTTERSNEEIFTLFGATNADKNNNIIDQNNAYGIINTTTDYASQSVFVLNVTSGDWSYIEPAKHSGIPQGRRESTAQYDSSTSQVVLFGGNSNDFQQISNSTGTVHYYNTRTSTWTTVSNTDTVRSRVRASSVLLKNRYFITFYGYSFEGSVQEIDIFDLQTQKFFVKEAYGSPLGLSKALQYGLVISTIVGIAILFAIAVVAAQQLHLIDNARALLTRIVYKPRNGEPVWAELLRSFAKLLCFIVFILFIVYSYDNIVNSPISITSDFQTVETLRYPDVRFCISSIDKYTYVNEILSIEKPSCDAVGAGVSNTKDCSDKIYKFHDNSRHTPFFDRYPFANGVCYMLVTNDNFIATPKIPRISISVPFVYKLQDPGVHINVYDPKYNPNRYIFLDEPLPTGWTMEDIDYWNVEGDTFLQQPNTFSSSGIGKFVDIFFENKTYKNLNPQAAGNYIGGSLFSSYDITSNYTVAFDRISRNSTGLTIRINVASFSVETITQRRNNTLLGAFATAGGILGLLTTILTLLFGSRPKSPWGLIHFITQQTQRRNLSRALDDGEDTTLIPLVEPVGECLAEVNIENSDERVECLTQHVSRIEARMQMFENVLQSYYIDDQVFQSLKENRDKNTSTNPSDSNVTDSTTKETLTSDKDSDKDIITESLLVENPSEDREQ